MTWEIVIGLEVHVQLSTRSKLFSQSSTFFGNRPNAQANAIDLGFPGVLPVVNKVAVEKAITFGLSIDAPINPKTYFERKNYFYPDLPKGYQTSQLTNPIVGPGKLNINQDDGATKAIRIHHAHLEEDAGKSVHSSFSDQTALDFNRAGIALLEIVSEPDMRNAKEAVAYMKTLHSLVRYLNICDGNMAEGSMRCDANVSVRRIGTQKLGTRCEIKNINSFKFIEKAINYEAQRQIELIEDGAQVKQQTRLYDEEKNETRPMRSKEEANDYRYFPCPDLLPIMIDKAWIAQIKSTLPELPESKKQRFMRALHLSQDVASQLVADQNFALYFEKLAKKLKNPKSAANWMMGEVSSYLNSHNIDITAFPLDVPRLGALIMRIEDGSINNKAAKTVFSHLLTSNKGADEIITKLGLKQVSDEAEIERIVEQVLQQNLEQVNKYKKSTEDKKNKMLGFFVGAIMKATKGKANPALVNQILKKKLQ